MKDQYIIDWHKNRTITIHIYFTISNAKNLQQNVYR